MSTPEGNLEVLNFRMMTQNKNNYIEVLKINTKNIIYAFKRTFKTVE